MLNYQIALTNAIFDDTYRNVLRFDTRLEQEAYFNVNTLFVNNPDLKCNFNVGTLYANSVVVDVNTTDLNEALNYNYCIVKDMTPNATIKYYYYFVKKLQQDNANRLVCDLELDVYQTYYIDLNFGDCAIVRAHLNRFVDNGDNTVSFDATPQSKLFEREEIKDVPKRLTKRKLISVTTDEGNTPNYYDTYIRCWLYLYLDPYQSFHFYTPDGTNKTVKPPTISVGTETNNPLPTNIGCLAIPIYNDLYATQDIECRDAHYGNTGLYVKLGGAVDFLKNFATLNNGFSYVYSAKLSIIPPGEYMGSVQHIMSNPELTGVWDPDGFNLAPLYLANGYIVSVDNTGKKLGAILLTRQPKNTYEFANVSITDREFTFNKNDIIGANTNIKFNPKLNNNDYYELNLVDNSGNSFTYDAQKFNSKTTNLLMTEPLTPDFTKNYSRLNPPSNFYPDPNNNTLYIAETKDNLFGLVSNNDDTILLPTSAYQSMIANNKNFYQQAQFNRMFNMGKGVANFASNIVSGNYSAALSGITNNGLDYYQSVKNQQYEIDNLRNAPSSIVSASGNFIFNAMHSKPGIYIEEYDIMENSKKAVNDFMMLYGFNYNRIDNIKNVDNIRKNYNYVQAYVEEIDTGVVNISNIVHNKIREIFAKGIRMWNLREFNYEKENYERWLEE